MGTKTMKMQTKDFLSKLVQENNVKQAGTGTKFWTMSKEQEPFNYLAKVYVNDNGVVYLRAETNDGEIHIGAPDESIYDAIQTLEGQKEVTVTLGLRVPNPALSDEDIERTRQSIAKTDGQAAGDRAVANIIAARAEGSSQLTLIDFAEA